MSRIISFSQLFALSKGVNYRFNSVFKGLPALTLLNPSGYTFTQPSFTTPASNLYQATSSVYSLADSKSISNLGLVFKTGGNLVETAMKWTNGKSIGNFYKILNHAGSPTGGFVGVENGILKIKCGLNTTLLNRGLMHDVKFNRAGSEVFETNASVSGYLQLTDTVSCQMYFKGYVESFNFNEIVAPLTRPNGDYVQFWIGWRYLHSQQTSQDTFGLPIFIGDGAGFGFIGVRNSSTSMTWWAVIIADDNSNNNLGTQVVYKVNTNKSIFSNVELQVSLNNGTFTFICDNTQIGQVTLSSLTGLGSIFNGGIYNPQYAGIASIKGSDSTTPPGQFTICVERCSVTRSLNHINTPYNRFEDTDTEVTSTDIDYHTTGLQLLKKLK